jgi:hypothetical protein
MSINTFTVKITNNRYSFNFKYSGTEDLRVYLFNKVLEDGVDYSIVNGTKGTDDFYSGGTVMELIAVSLMFPSSSSDKKLLAVFASAYNDRNSVITLGKLLISLSILSIHCCPISQARLNTKRIS